MRAVRGIVAILGLILGFIAVADAAAELYFIHPDHLNTPRLIANAAGQTVWTWVNDDPFGNNAPNEDPSSLRAFTCNLRLPGQYFDKETNLHYNYFRDYDPAIGRYIQGDPIGLAGGLNLYAYVDNNPLSFTDPMGLQSPQVKLPVPPQPQASPQPNPSQPNTVQQAMQGAANYQQCVQNASAAGGFVGACVGGVVSRGSIPVTVISLVAGALGGQLIGQAICTPDPTSGPTGGRQ